ncbi:glutamate--cysteine ligase [Pseudonocardia sediminis]|uniref:Glutamate--cysteine ligase EgtA n=1 Tax=Pseudonocardia sediminis TaxID=1397368 RepID=A0A4Q7UWN2_PSEST|nr:ergothioneine biosynthesis glutamate--cysteine ligase EgtA [Pseudonocardia sediminis]RZT86266.1 glutamate--cysteine ligase [Pseudonocardia sediminis]
MTGEAGDAAARDDAGPGVLRSRAEAEAYVASVCFKHGPPRLVGVELEWMLYRPETPDAPVDVDTLRAALGPHAPKSLDPSSPALPLPGGCDVTVEPGGQIEIAGPPLPDLGSLLRDVTRDADRLHALLAAKGLRPHARAADPVRPARRLLDLPRYRAMECAFDRVGPHGRSGMCSTSSVQVCLDAGTVESAPQRWDALHALGPVLVAAFANSPVLHGRVTGWKSSRMASWLSLDPLRTAPPPVSDDPARTWAERVVSTPLLCVRSEGSWEVPPQVTFADWIDGAGRGRFDGVLSRPPTTTDLDYHVSTMFPPVRPHGHLEVRYVDGQDGRDWALPTALLLALTSDSGALDRAREACEPVRDHWVTASRDALADPALARAAATVFTLACEVLRRSADAGRGTGLAWGPSELVARLEEVTEQRVLRGRCPADDPSPLETGAPGVGAPETPFPAGLYRPAPAPPRPEHGRPDGTSPAATARPHVEEGAR